MGFAQKVKIGKGQYADGREYVIPRHTGIGGSDVDAVFSLPPYGCARRLWYEKLRVAPDFPDVTEDSYHIKRGKLFEALAADVYALKTKRVIRRPNRAFRSDQYPFMTANFDRLIVERDGSKPLEIKNPSKFSYFKAKKEGLPDYWLLQLQHYIFVKNAPWGSFFVFSPEMADGVWFDLERDDGLIADIIKGEAAFWKLVEEKKSPEKLEVTDNRCSTCLWRITCHGEIGEYLTPDMGIEEDYDPELAVLTNNVLVLQDEVRERLEAIEAFKIDIIKRMAGRPKIMNNNAKVFYGKYERSKWNTKQLEKDLPKLALIYKKKIPVISLRIFPYNQADPGVDNGSD